MIAGTHCSRQVSSKLDDVTRMAYAVKPAVVRISAYSTAVFRCDSAAIDAAGAVLALRPEHPPRSEESVETGAGGSGSGFIINPDGLILTSGHVVAPTRELTTLRRELLRNGAIATLVAHYPIAALRARHQDEQLEQAIGSLASAGTLTGMRIINDVELSNGEKLPFTTIHFTPPLTQRGSDLALLRVKRTNLPAIRLGDSESVRVGETIWSVGYPAVADSTDEVIGGWLSRESDLEATFNLGSITALKRNAAGTEVFQSNVAIYRGNSGGPAVDRDGEAIGISTWGHPNAEAIKFLVPINVAKAVLAAAGIRASSEGSFNQHYRTALDAARDGDWPRAQSELRFASAIFPHSPDLIRFRRDTDRALASLPPWRLHPVASITAAAAVLMAILGMTIVLMSKQAQTVAAMSGAGFGALAVAGAPAMDRLIAPVGRNTGSSSTSIPQPVVLGRFTILNGDRAGEKLGLGGSGIRIGRESAICEIVLPNPKVSRLHAELVTIDGKVLLIDRNSSNGTFVNDHKIDKRFLKNGDIIYFGGRNAVAVAFHGVAMAEGGRVGGQAV